MYAGRRGKKMTERFLLHLVQEANSELEMRVSKLNTSVISREVIMIKNITVGKLPLPVSTNALGEVIIWV